MSMDFESWRCTRYEGKFCPLEGCPRTARDRYGIWTKYGCARDRGWKTDDPSPAECRGVIPKPRAAERPAPRGE